MSDRKKASKKTPRRASGQGDKELTTTRRLKNIDHLKLAKSTIKKQTKEALKAFKKGMFSMTLDARTVDLTAYRHKRIEDLVKKRFEKHEKRFLLKLDALSPKSMTTVQYRAYLKKIDNLVKKHKYEKTSLQQALRYAYMTLAGYNGKIEKKDYAYFYSVLDNVSNLFSKNVKISQTFMNIQGNNIRKRDWDVICKYIKQYPYQKNVTGSNDNIRLSVTAFFFQIMNPHQRFQAVLEFKRRYGATEAIKLVDALTKATVLNMKQHEVLMARITGRPYSRSKAKETALRKQREISRRIIAGVEKNMSKPLHINGATRVLNRRTIFSFLVTGIGVAGMIANYMAHLNNTKGLGRYVAGFKSPYFMFSAAVAAGGVHMLGKSMRPGKGVGWFDRLIPRPKRLTNPFGVGKFAEKQDRQMDILADICKNQKIVEKWLLHQQGFDDIWGFYTKKRRKMQRLKHSVLEADTKKKMFKNKEPLLKQFIKYQMERGNKKGAVMVREAARVYGKAKMEEYIIRLTMACDRLGINSTKQYYRKTTRRNIKYTDVFLNKQGVKALPQRLTKKPKVKAKTKTTKK